MDFAKAFDKVPHQLLLPKLSEVSDISKQILDWLQDLQFNRKQKKVVIKGKALHESLEFHRVRYWGCCF